MKRNIQYWIDYWTSLFTGIEHRRFTLSLISPRVLLREMIEEVETRSLKNSDNRRFLYDQINEYFENDPPTQRCLLPILTLVRREFEKPRLDLLVQLCRRGLGVFDSLQYFDCAVDALADSLLAEAPVNRKTLATVCQDLIVELLEAGYSQKFIEAVPRNLFSEVIEHGEIVTTQFPHDIAYPTGDADPSKKEAYCAELRAYMNKLTVKDRLDALKKYPRLPRQELRFIFQVRGIRGKDAFDIGPAHFYAPTEEKVLKDIRGMKMNEHPELFRSHKQAYLNAVVTMRTIDTHSGAALARRQLIEALNCLRFALSSRAQYEIGQDYVVVDKDGRLAGMFSSRDRRSGLLHWHESLEVTADVLQIIKNSDILQRAAPHMIAKSRRGQVERKFMDSLHWFRKGKEAEASEDQLLWLWISIENLLNPASSAGGPKPLLRTYGQEKETVISIAFDLLPRLRCLANAYDRGWALFDELDSMLSFPPPLRIFTLPDELKKRAGFNQKGEKIYLRNFVEAIPEILTHMPDTVLREHLQEAHEFYSNASQAIEVIEKERKAFRNDAVMLYRTRNKIVHSASVGDTTLPYYIRSASEFARELIRKSLVQFFHQNNKTLEGILAAIFSEYDLLLENIRKDGPVLALFERN